MTISEFVTELEKFKHDTRVAWGTKPIRRFKLSPLRNVYGDCPIMCIARHKGLGEFSLSEYHEAGKALGLTRVATERIVMASDAARASDLRSRILSACAPVEISDEDS